MEFDENLAAVHAYLCGDGYVIKNPSTQKNKYYYIGFRNTNEDLLRDFQKRFNNYFGVKPRFEKDGRCIVQRKELYENLTSEFGSFYSREWTMPKLDNKLLSIWLRSFFDCEGWIFCRTHQNRHIGFDSVNEKGIDQIRKGLGRLGIVSIKKINRRRGMFRIFIYGKSNLEKFRKEIGFLHPEKKDKLDKTILDYVEYIWDLKEDRDSIRKLMLGKARVKKPYIVRVISKEESNLDKLKQDLHSIFNIENESIKINLRINGLGTKYFEMSINKRIEVEKLIKQNLINGDQLKKMELPK